MRLHDGGQEGKSGIAIPYDVHIIHTCMHTYVLVTICDDNTHSDIGTLHINNLAIIGDKAQPRYTQGFGNLTRALNKLGFFIHTPSHVHGKIVYVHNAKPVLDPHELDRIAFVHKPMASSGLRGTDAKYDRAIQKFLRRNGAG